MGPTRGPHVSPLWAVAVLLSSSAWSADDLQGTCTPGPTTLCLQSARFAVEIDWEDFEAQTGEGQVLPFGSDDTGFFWFAEPALVDNYVKVIDGTVFNGHFWVFFASLTNVAYTLTVTDTATGNQAVYTNPLGSFTSVTDTMALEDAPLPVTAPRLAPAAGSQKIAGPPDKGAGGSCVASATALCLDQGRFQIEVDWRDFAGSTGPGQAVQLTDNSGYYWFFALDNVDMAVKIHDGGDGFFWIFYGATTDVEYTITVTDTCAATARTYFNPLGSLTSSGDFTAFSSGTDCAVFTDGFESGDVSRWSGTAGG